MSEEAESCVVVGWVGSGTSNIGGLFCVVDLQLAPVASVAPMLESVPCALGSPVQYFLASHFLLCWIRSMRAAAVCCNSVGPGMGSIPSCVTWATLGCPTLSAV